MSYFLPLFPLNLVAFPEERLNLHIFEPRYKQLIKDTMEGNKRFGIPAYVKARIEYGTEMEIVEIFKTYEDGRMDIKTLGHKIFKVEQFDNPWPEKQYAGGHVEALENIWDVVPAKFEMIKLMNRLYHQIQLSDEMVYDEDTPVFTFAHKVGLTLEQEYKLIQISKESERVDFVVAHLRSLLPRLTEAEEIRQRIKMNGHFRHLDSLDF